MLQPQDFIPVLLYILVRDGLPWLMRTFFPAWFKSREHKYSGELEIRKMELRMKEEASLREAKWEERTAKALEGIERYLKELNDFQGRNSVQLTTLRAEVANMSDEQRTYFVEGRKAIKEIAVLSSKARKRKTR